MKKGYMGIDVGSISTKAVVLDEEKNIHASTYIWTEGDPISAVKRCLADIKAQLNGSIAIMGIGTTGSARKLTGSITNANIVKNEITAHAVGTLTYHKDVQTILEIGGQDSKIIILRNGLVVDFAMNTLCAAGTGAFLTSQARRLRIPIEEFGAFSLRSVKPTRIAGRCTVFAESDLVHKAQIGHTKEDIIAGLCQSITKNYLNNVGKGKDILAPIVFQGGVSKNIGVVKAFEELLSEEIIVDEAGHLMGAIGIAVLSMGTDESLFDFEAVDIDFTTRGVECGKCPNECEIICVFSENQLTDAWGNRCSVGLAGVKKKYEVKVH